MICPACGGSVLVKDIRDMEYTYKGETTLVMKVAGDYCLDCNEGILGTEETRRVMEAMTAFNDSINATKAR